MTPDHFVETNKKEIFETEELLESSTIGIFPIVQTEGTRQIKRNIRHYNLDMVA